MKSKKYSSTGNFTKRQVKLAEEISVRLKELSESGCTIVGNLQTLKIYRTEDLEHAANHNYPSLMDLEHEVPCLEAGRIDDSNQEEKEYFRIGYITQE